MAIRIQILVEYCLVAAVTSGAIFLVLENRGMTILELLTGTKDPTLAFTKALCFADGIVLGTTASMVCLHFAQQVTGLCSKVWPHLVDFGGTMAIYSLVVGTVFCVIDFHALTTMQLAAYLIVTVVNIQFARHFIRESARPSAAPYKPRSEPDGK